MEADLVAADMEFLSLFPQSAVHRLHQLRRATSGIQLVVKVFCSFHQTVQVDRHIITLLRKFYMDMYPM